jgi:hypothetical protein
MQIRLVLYSLSLLALAACSGATAPKADDIVLIPTKSTYAAGETVSAQLFNRSQEQVGFGACSVRVEHLAASQWVLVGPEQIPCILLLIVVEPQSTRMLQVPLDQTLEAGTYRLRQDILPRTNLPSRRIYSPEFQLQNVVSL